MIETITIAVGKIASERAAALWLAGRNAQAERNKDLIELIKFRFRDRISQRRVERQIAEIADTVAERLLTLCGHEYSGLTDNEKEAALLETTEVLEQADLSDEAIFDADADPVKLAGNIRAHFPGRAEASFLNEVGSRFYDAVLDECCDCIVRIVRELPSFEARGTVEIIARLGVVTEGINAMLARMPIRSLEAPDGTADDEEFRRRYLEQVSSTLDSVELFGVRVERYRPRTTLSVAYISLSVSGVGSSGQQDSATEVTETTARIREWRIPPHSEQAMVRVETALARSRLTLIRGEAGSGKSTLLRWLAVTASRSAFSTDLSKWNGCVPFLVKLRSHADGLPPPEKFLTGVADAISGLMPSGWVHRQLSSGRAILLVDGVDELSGAQRRAVRPWLASLLADNPRIRVVVTSRPAAARSDWLGAEGFNTAFLERMSPTDVRALILHWHAAMREAGDLPCAPEKLVSYETALLARLEGAPHLQALASTPLLATMLCALNLDRDTQLPRDRMSLYAAILDLLLERRDSERHIPSFLEIALEREQKIQLLQDLAWRLSTTSRTELPKELVLRRIAQKLDTIPRVSASAETVLDHLLQRSGVIREPAIGRIDFVHRTVQEYLTAQYAADDGDVQPVIDHAHRDQWHDIVIMTAGHANLPLRQELLTGLLSRGEAEPRYARRMKLLVAACLETLPAIPQGVRADIDRCLDDLIPPSSLASARSLATVGESVLDRLPESLNDFSEGTARAIVRTAWLINGPNALDALSRYGADVRESVQEELVRGWDYFDPVEYASRVLASTPFADGNLWIRSGTVLRGLSYLSGYSMLTVQPPEPIEDISFVRDVPHITHLGVTNVISNDLRPVSEHIPDLTHLRVQVHQQIEDFDPLTSLVNLTYLNLNSPGINDLGFLESMPQLTELYLNSINDVTNYRPLLVQQNLETLSLQYAHQLRDVELLPPLHNIRTLILTASSLECGLETLIGKMPQVTDLNLRASDWLNDISPLSNLDLGHLTLWDCGQVSDLSPLSGCTNLRFLDLEKTGVGDLAPLAELSELRTLYLTDCPDVSDLSPLAGLNKLSRLYIDGTQPGIDVSPLANNKRLKVFAYSDISNGHLFGRRLSFY